MSNDRPSLIFKLVHRPEASDVRVGPSRRIEGTGFLPGDLGPLNDALAGLPQGSRWRQTFPRTVERLRALHRGTEPDLAFWFVVILPPGTLGASSIGAALRTQAPVIEKLQVAPRSRPASDLDYAGPSGAGGVGATEAWAVQGGTGSGTLVCLVDHGYDATHPWLPPMTTHNLNTNSKLWDVTHGTWCAGVVLMQEPMGFKGIAYAAQPHFSQNDGDLPWALDQAQDALGAGDVIWIPSEAILVNEPARNTDVGHPEEVAQDVFAWIQPMTDLGVVVVEAAGNGYTDATGAPKGHLLSLPGSPGDDSGAILVGAGGNSTGVSPQVRVVGNYGSRVDCQGWGEGIVTTCPMGNGRTAGIVSGAGVMTQDLDYVIYTSAASSMVAGIAAVVESVAKSCSRGAISAVDLRAALRDPTLGLPCQGADPIGPLPDLRRLLEHFELFPDSFLRDHVGDTGAEPSDPAFTIWGSPDIIPRLQVEADPQGTLAGANWDLDLAESPPGGTTCQLYVRLQNRSFVPQDVWVDLYWAYEGTYISPSQWHFIGTTPALSPGRDYTGAGSPERVVAGPLAWHTPNDTTHPCLIAVLRAAAEPLVVPGPMTNDVDYAAFVRQYNNVTHRNIILGGAIVQPLHAWTFEAYVPTGEGGPPVLRLIPKNLGGARAFLGLGDGRLVRHGVALPLLGVAELARREGLRATVDSIRKALGRRRLGDRRRRSLPRRWATIHEAGDLVLEDVAPGESVPVTVVLYEPDRRQEGELRIVQCRGDVPIGAVTYRFR